MSRARPPTSSLPAATDRVAGAYRRLPASRRRRSLIDSSDDGLPGAGPFGLLIVFMLVTFLNIPNRFPAMGIVRPTLLLTALLMVCVFAHWDRLKERLSVPASKWLVALVAYIVLSLPFVAWPGSVITNNFELFVRSIVFFFFVVAFVDTTKRLQLFILAFVSCQIFRCLEPLYLHFTIGYWGSATYLSYEDAFMARLAGAPADPINGNGLAFVVVTAVPFVHYWAMSRPTVFRLLAYAAVMPLLVYALVLTASRSGLVALAVIALGIIWFSKRRVVSVALVLICVVMAFPRLSANQQDRYASLIDHHSRQGNTAQGRFDGWIGNAETFVHRPIFGFGLGTSLEASNNLTGDGHLAHNLYLEVLIELGILGFLLFMGYIKVVVRSAFDIFALVQRGQEVLPAGIANVYIWLPKALFVYLAMSLLFSMASYGLSEYQWYLIGGLVVVARRLMPSEMRNAEEGEVQSPVSVRGRNRPRMA